MLSDDELKAIRENTANDENASYRTDVVVSLLDLIDHLKGRGGDKRIESEPPMMTRPTLSSG